MTIFETKYGKGTQYTVTSNGQTISGIMYGNDECYEDGRFYQILVADSKIYYCYYDVPEGCDDLGTLDYDHPMEIADRTYMYDRERREQYEWTTGTGRTQREMDKR